jgi:glutathione-regulated potassium-efflux system ancillary protein KefC
MGLFFISVGMSINFGLLLAEPLVLLALVVLLVVVKGVVLWGLTYFCNILDSQKSLFVFLLSQGGEFAFVLFGVATGQGLLDSALVDKLIVVVALSMVTTPLLLLLYERVIAPRYIRPDEPQQTDDIDDGETPVIIAGFGRFGRTVGRLLHANGIPTTILDYDPDRIEAVRRFGYKVYYGDASRHDVLEIAGAEHARLLIVAIDDQEMALQVVEQARKHYPHLVILSRADDNGHAYELMRRGVQLFRREYYASALHLGEDALKQLGFGAYRAKQAANIFNDYDQELLQKLYETEEFEVRRSLSLQTREQLEKVLTADAEEISRSNREGWE